MPNVAQPAILNAIAAIVGNVPDTGKILTRERFCTNEAQFVALFKDLNQQIGKGWLITYVGFTQERDGDCEVIRTMKYALECLYPYEDKDFQGNDSHAKFRAMVEAVNDAFNLESKIGLGLNNDRVRHQLLQVSEDFIVRSWGEGAGALSTHYGTFTLEVTNEVNVKGT
jgi:hypothetical protein